MTRPGDDPALPPPADPWATIDRPVPTVHLGGPDTTVHLGPHGPAATPHGPAAAPHGPAGPTAAPYGPAGVPLAPTRHEPQREPTAPTVRVHEQMRFGPGVPVPPAVAPGWPAAAPAPRRRWRRLVSILSSLLTLALLAVVGFYLWQQLSPLEVESATVAVPRPAGNRCDVTVDVVATVRTNGRSGVIRYQWLRSGSPPGPELTERVGRGQRTAALTLKWTFSGVGTTTETATVNIVQPSPLQASTRVTYRCRRG